MKQITVIAAPGSDLITDLTQLLSKYAIDIRNISYKSNQQQAIAQLQVSDYDQALQVINAASFTAIPHESIAVHLNDEPGALAKLAKRISDLGVEIRSLNLLPQQQGIAIAMVNTNDNDTVRKALDSLSIN